MYRILSLDGGGSWALLEVQALAEIFGEATPGHEILANFELVVANSGGSIVAAGLAAGLTPRRMLELLLSQQRRDAIFVPVWYRSLSGRIPLPRYHAAAKRAGLAALFDDVEGFNESPMSDWTKGRRLPDFVILSFDFDSQRATFFRSNLTSRASSDPAATSPTFVEAVDASSTAPVRYFDDPVHVDGRRYWDGAMGGFNNPLLAGVTEALANGHSDVWALSLGTATTRKIPASLPVSDSFLVETPEPTDVFSAVQEATMCILDDPPDMATFVAHTILSKGAAKQRVVRLNPMIRGISDGSLWTFPRGFAPAEFMALAQLEMDAVSQPDIDLIKRLGEAWIAGDFANQPIRESDQLECQIGSPTFADGVKAYRSWPLPRAAIGCG